MKRLAIAVALAAGLTGCQESYEDQSESFRKQVAKKQLGSSADHWLVKRNIFDQDERVGLIFGFTDDAEFCQEIAELYMRKHNGDTYKCRPAN